MSLHLSKSKYCSAVQCPKMLWLKANKPEEFDDSVMNQAVLQTGSEVGDLAMGLLGDFVEVPFSKNLHEMIDKTKELINNGTPIICEASFAYGGLFFSADILKNLGNNEVELYEVKSSTEVHWIYEHDVAYQYYVLSKLGYKVKKACLIHINNEYVRHGDLDLHQLFTIEDLTSIVEGMQDDVDSNIKRFTKYMEQTDEPEKDICEDCFDPYECGFWKYCTRNLPTPNIFDVARMRKKQKFKYYRDGIISFEDIQASGTVSDSYMVQIDHELGADIPTIDKSGIEECLSTLSYPLFFLDFETFQPAIPLYDNSKPFQQIVFQYSLHYIEKEGDELKHKEYLAYPGEDPRRGVAEALCRDIPWNVCTTAYNMGFEKGRIKELAEIFPDLADHLMNIHDNIQDLMIPFQKKYYYNKAMQGSYSIKYVLPALFPDDPSLDYHNLEGVHNGGEASSTFMAMQKMDKDELEEWRINLLKYCGLDTYAMVKVWEALKDVIK